MHGTFYLTTTLVFSEPVFLLSLCVRDNGLLQPVFPCKLRAQSPSLALLPSIYQGLDYPCPVRAGEVPMSTVGWTVFNELSWAQRRIRKAAPCLPAGLSESRLLQIFQVAAQNYLGSSWVRGLEDLILYLFLQNLLGRQSRGFPVHSDILLIFVPSDPILPSFWLQVMEVEMTTPFQQQKCSGAMVCHRFWNQTPGFRSQLYHFMTWLSCLTVFVSLFHIFNEFREILLLGINQISDYGSPNLHPR